MTFSADGTGHRNINYNSRHVNMAAEGYGSSNANKKKVTRFLGIMPSLDNSSEESIKDLQKVLGTTIDIFNQSPFGKRCGNLLCLVDILIKLFGMMSDHCAKERKDAEALEKMKLEAIFQTLGEDVILDSSNQELLLEFMAANEAMIAEAGGQTRWNNLSEEEQAERRAKMMEDYVKKLGNEAYDMLSESEKHALSLFIWAGCGCHKDLNTVRGGHAAMTTWWAENGIEGPVKLANRDNAATLKDVIPGDGILTPAQERAFEKTVAGAIKAVQTAGGVLNHKDDKKGHHNMFCYWWQTHVMIDFTFPDMSNNRFGTNCLAAGMLLLYLERFLEYLEFSCQRKTTRKFNHMEKSLWDALHCHATLTELAVLALYGISTSQPYLKKVPSAENMMTLSPLHKKVQAHITRIINDPDFLIGDNASFEMGTLDGKEWEYPAIFEKIQSMKSTMPYLKPLLVQFHTGALETRKQFMSEFSPGGLIDEATEGSC